MPKLNQYQKNVMDQNSNFSSMRRRPEIPQMMDENTPLLVSSQPKRRVKRSSSSSSGKYHPSEMYYPEMMAAKPSIYRRRGRSPSPAGGWSDQTDSEDEYRKHPWKRPEASETQSYMVIAMVVAILAILAALKGYNIYHGTEEKEENRPKGGYY